VVAPLRRNRGVDAIDRDAPGTPRALVRALRRGGIAGFLVDVDTRVASVTAPFFGRPARTPSGAARLALGTGAPVVAAFATRDGISVELLRPASPRETATDERVLTLVSAMNRAIEAAITREPTRWIWMHDRFASHKKQTSPAFAELAVSDSE
jgi:KDO2-lipid IV(A) lauroyltransferase